MRPVKRERLKTFLGSWREKRGTSSVSCISCRECGTIVIEELLIARAAGPTIPATLCRPGSVRTRAPAVLYAHAHGNRYEIGRRELTEGRPALLIPPYGPLLADRGYAVLCLDMPAFGGRLEESENALSKRRLWYGATMMGDMLTDLAAGLDVLCARPDIDPSRIGMFGISMGATHAFWLAALDERVAAVAQLCVFASLKSLIALGAHDAHGPYLTVPGLLAEMDSGDIAGMVAPRPQLVGVGLRDPLTPQLAVEAAWLTAVEAYQRAGAREAISRIVEPKGGHGETERMRFEVLKFLDRHLQNRGDETVA